MDKLPDRIDACLANLGRDAFIAPYLAAAEALPAEQVMVFAFSGDRARCLLSRHFRRSALGGRLAEQYLDGWYRRDPLLPLLYKVAPGNLQVCTMRSVAQGMDPDYRRLFFDTPGLPDKTSVLAAGHRHRLIVNFYHRPRAAAAGDAPLFTLMGRLALLHFEKLADDGTPPPLAALSPRERAVCLGILAGQKAETIAGELEVAPSTVVTYRRRAYEKLGVSSRAQLFGLCARRDG